MGGSSNETGTSQRRPTAAGRGLASARLERRANGSASPTRPRLRARPVRHHDDGRRRRALEAHDRAVRRQSVRLAVAHNTVYTAAGNAESGVNVWTTPVGSTQWTAHLTGVSIGAGPIPDSQLVFSGQHAWLIQVNRTVIGGAQLGSDGQWHPWTPPCASAGGAAFLAASSPSDLVASCEEGAYTGPRVTHGIYFSKDGGQTFTLPRGSGVGPRRDAERYDRNGHRERRRPAHDRWRSDLARRVRRAVERGRSRIHHAHAGLHRLQQRHDAHDLRRRGDLAESDTPMNMNGGTAGRGDRPGRRRDRGVLELLEGLRRARQQRRFRTPRTSTDDAPTARTRHDDDVDTTTTTTPRSHRPATPRLVRFGRRGVGQLRLAEPRLGARGRRSHRPDDRRRPNLAPRRTRSVSAEHDPVPRRAPTASRSPASGTAADHARRGATWTVTPTPFPNIFDLAIARHDRRQRVEPPARPAFHIWTSPVAHLVWKQVPPTMAVGAGPVASQQIVLNGGHGWILGVNRTVIAGAPTTASRPGSTWTPPCLHEFGPAYLRRRPRATSWRRATKACGAATSRGITPTVVVLAQRRLDVRRARPRRCSVRCCRRIRRPRWSSATARSQRTTDGGATWTSSEHSRPATRPTKGFTTSTQGFVITGGQMLMTHDAGATWQRSDAAVTTSASSNSAAPTITSTTRVVCVRGLDAPPSPDRRRAARRSAYGRRARARRASTRSAFPSSRPQLRVERVHVDARRGQVPRQLRRRTSRPSTGAAGRR